MSHAPELTMDLRVELVRAAIERVKYAKQRHEECQADPYSDSDDRDAARDCYRSVEREFGWQWKNVEAILDYLKELETVSGDLSKVVNEIAAAGGVTMGANGKAGSAA